MTLMRRFIVDDRGQDLVEYVLLGATVALAGLTAMSVFPGFINAVYTSWINQTQNLWSPADPQP